MYPVKIYSDVVNDCILYIYRYDCYLHILVRYWNKTIISDMCLLEVAKKEKDGFVCPIYIKNDPFSDTKGELVF
jgi:hypothetical protein